MKEEEDILDYAENDDQNIEGNSNINYFKLDKDDNDNIKTILINDYDSYHRF